MSELKATPRPWFVCGESPNTTWNEGVTIGKKLVDSRLNAQRVADVCVLNPEYKANAHLIAAAPDMYEYIARLPCPNSLTPCRAKEYDSENVYEGCPFCTKRDSILKKARGEL